MLYDQFGRPIEAPATVAPPSGKSVIWEPADRDPADVSRGLTPLKVDSIMQLADSGDTADMCLLAEKIDDKNFDIGAALSTRRAAIAATPWSIQPADDSAQAKRIAEECEAMLRHPHPDNDLLSFEQAVEFELGSALLPGFSCPEIIWDKGGRAILGFQTIAQRHFSFRDSRTPRLITTDQPAGIELPPAKFMLHWHRSKSGDAVRGGLIRACAWLHCFANINIKDLLRFVERYGMPFLLAKVDRQSWEADRNKLKAIIKNFGPDGGGVFSNSVEAQLLETHSTGDVYFKLLEYLRDAAEKIILGQTLTSSAGGVSNNGAQHMVRMDIRDSDCRQIDATVNSRILPYWTAWNYGPAAPAPRMVHDVQESKDAQAEATVIKTLGEAGWDVEPEQITEATGYRVTRRAAPAPASVALSQESARATGNALAAIMQTLGRHDAAALQDGGTDTVDPADALADSALTAARAALPAWFGPLQRRLDTISAIADDAEFRRESAALVADLAELQAEMDTADFEDALAQTVIAANASARAARAAELQTKEK